MTISKKYNDNLIAGGAVRDGNGKRIDTTYADIEKVVTKIESGNTADKIKITKAGSTTDITINNVANAISANSIITKDGITAYQWIGTTSEYTIALNNGTITSTTLCIITDD